MAKVKIEHVKADERSYEVHVCVEPENGNFYLFVPDQLADAITEADKVLEKAVTRGSSSRGRVVWGVSMKELLEKAKTLFTTLEKRKQVSRKVIVISFNSDHSIMRRGKDISHSRERYYRSHDDPDTKLDMRFEYKFCLETKTGDNPPIYHLLQWKREDHRMDEDDEKFPLKEVADSSRERIDKNDVVIEWSEAREAWLENFTDRFVELTKKMKEFFGDEKRLVPFMEAPHALLLGEGDAAKPKARKRP